MKEIQYNKKLSFDYTVLKKLEVGIVLQSYEIKQIVNKKCNIKNSFAKIVKNEVFLFDMNIERYENAVFYEKLDEKRPRKLLLHKREIKKLNEELILNNGLTLVPLRIYINDNGICKLELSLCKGKNNFDKRQTLKEKDIKLNLTKKDVYETKH